MRPHREEMAQQLVALAEKDKSALKTLGVIVGMSRREYRAWLLGQVASRRREPEHAPYRTMRRTFRGIMPRREAEKLAGTLL